MHITSAKYCHYIILCQFVCWAYFIIFKLISVFLSVSPFLSLSHFILLYFTVHNLTSSLFIDSFLSPFLKHSQPVFISSRLIWFLHSFLSLIPLHRPSKKSFYSSFFIWISFFIVDDNDNSSSSSSYFFFLFVNISIFIFPLLHLILSHRIQFFFSSPNLVSLNRVLYHSFLPFYSILFHSIPFHHLILSYFNIDFLANYIEVYFLVMLLIDLTLLHHRLGIKYFDNSIR